MTVNHYLVLPCMIWVIIDIKVTLTSIITYGYNVTSRVDKETKMCPVIRISDELYERLESQAIGFDTPAALIERLLDKCDGIEKSVSPESPKRPDLIFSPSDEDKFKKLLLRKKSAAVKLHKVDGSIENRSWNADRLSETSNVRGNLWSGLLRGWKKKGIVKAELTIAEK